jgi:VIT1/CCC1 family predicted Fe2+/Mn2+ transporter
MLNLVATAISVIITLFVFGIIWYRNSKLTDKTKYIDNTHTALISGGTLIVSYLVSHLLTSNDENKILMNNIKTGEPPF